MKLGRPPREAFSFLFVTANVCVWSSEGSLVDVAHKWSTEAVDEELDRLIEKRSSRDVDPDERDETWKESVRRYNARQQEENRQAWCEYHQGQAARHRAVLAELIARHEAQAAKLEDGKE
jgi:hypothetical protein